MKEFIKSSNSKEKEGYQDLLKDHRNFTRGERLLYYDRREEAEEYPHKAMSIIMDGMDQAKCIIPHHPKYEIQNGIKTKLTGVLVHGKEFHGYISHESLSGKYFFTLFIRRFKFKY